jgi:hypothetical protein
VTDDVFADRPLRAVTDDVFAMDVDPRRLRQLRARLRTRLTSHLAHEEADALALIARIMSPGELGRIATAIRSGHNVRRAAVTVPWALTYASPTSATRY